VVARAKVRVEEVRMGTLEGVRGFALKELAGWTQDFRDALAEKEPSLPADTLLDDTRTRLEAMLSTIADPGALAPQMRAFTVGGAIYVAFYLALHAHGRDAAQVWTVCERATRLHFERMRGLTRTLASEGMHGWPMKALTRWIAGRTKAEPVGGWVFEYVEGGEAFGYGVDYHRCAIRELAIANGAADFAPYICLSDIIGSETLGWGLTRTETLAQGGKRCDFRFTRGGPTEVRSRLPVVPS
jgi:hypothetical protein